MELIVPTQSICQLKIMEGAGDVTWLVGCSPSTSKAQGPSPMSPKPSVVRHTYGPCMLVTPALKILKQEDCHEFLASLGYVVRLCLRK